MQAPPLTGAFTFTHMSILLPRVYRSTALPSEKRQRPSEDFSLGDTEAILNTLMENTDPPLSTDDVIVATVMMKKKLNWSRGSRSRAWRKFRVLYGTITSQKEIYPRLPDCPELMSQAPENLYCSTRTKTTTCGQWANYIAKHT